MFTANTLGVNEEGDALILEGESDLWIIGLTSGTIQLQVKFPGEAAYKNAPEGTFTADVMKTIGQGEHGVWYKLIGVSNNAGVYVRLAKPVYR